MFSIARKLIFRQPFSTLSDKITGSVIYSKQKQNNDEFITPKKKNSDIRGEKTEKNDSKNFEKLQEYCKYNDRED